MHFRLTLDDELNADTDVVSRTINFFKIFTSFLAHHIYLKLHIIVWIILNLEKVLVLCGMVVFFNMEPYK